MSDSKNNQIFEYELQVIQKAHSVLNKVKHERSEVADEYAKLLKSYEKLYKVSKKISSISDVQGLMLKQREEDITLLLEHVSQGFLTIGTDFVVNNPYSKECDNIFGCRILGKDVTELVWGDFPSERTQMSKLLRSAFAADGNKQAAELLKQLPSLLQIGEKRVTLECKCISKVARNETKKLMMVILTDVTEQLESQEKVTYLSFHDSLTSLYNRYYIEQLIEEGTITEQLPLSMIVLDMNGLKLANDLFGHFEGDRLLIKAADTLKQVFDDDAILARWGGDEFIVLLPFTDEQAATEWMMELKQTSDAQTSIPIRLSMAYGKATMMSRTQSFDQIFYNAEKQMYKQKLLENKKVRKEMIQDVTQALRERGLEEEGHYDRLLHLATGFAAYLQIDPASDEYHLLLNLVKLHDSGKLALHDAIVLKKGPLDDEEWELMESHSEVGSRMAQSIGEWELAEAIKGMHERWDGQGYPNGISDEQIPYVSRLLSILDVYDVMTHDQIYKKAVPVKSALQQIKASSGSHFDPKLVEAFMEWIKT